MSWFLDLLLGFFTRHLGAKLLALLLSLGLFGFVQASLTGTQEVALLELRFSLAEEQRKDYVLLTDKAILHGLTMTGMRSKVDPLARLYRGNPVVNLNVDQRFLNLHGTEEVDAFRIRITPRLFEDEALFGKDIAVGPIQDDLSVVLEKIDTRTARLEAAPDVPASLPSLHEYEGRIVLSFSPKSVTLIGPKSAFTGAESRVLVSVPHIATKLATIPIGGAESGVITLQGVEIKWKEGNIAPERVPLLRVQAPSLGSDPIWAKDLAPRIVVSCPVTKRKVTKTLRAVPIEIRYPVPREFDLVEDYNVLSGVTDADLSDGRMQQLKVRLPAGLSESEEFLKNIVVVLDVAAAKGEPESMWVPFHLDVKDRDREEDLSSLRQVDIDTETLAEFRKKR